LHDLCSDRFDCIDSETRPSMPSSLFTDWSERHAQLFGQHIVNLGHRLHTSPLFDDAALAKLIERTPAVRCHVNTMDTATHDRRTRREGIIRGHDGHAVLDAVRDGRIWILLQNPGDTEPAYRDLLAGIYDEIDRLSGLRTFKQKMSILISSPRIRVYYHADVPGQTLWQVRGMKRVWVYPNAAPFLPQPALERIVMGEAHEISLDYEPWFDEYAEVVDLEPGRMLHWPLNCPHRIDNLDTLNVSFTTEHWTRELRAAYAVNYANGLLRRTLGRECLSQSTTDLVVPGKAALAAAHKLSGLQKKRRARFKIDFEVDPGAPGGVRDIAPIELVRA
jgi:hypothetical protein